MLLLSSHGAPADVLEPPLPLHRHYVPHCVECLRSGHHTSHQPHHDGDDGVDEKYDIIVINGTRPKPTYGQQGIAGGIVGPGCSSSNTFWGVFNVSIRASNAQLKWSIANWIFGVSRGGGVVAIDPRT